MKEIRIDTGGAIVIEEDEQGRRTIRDATKTELLQELAAMKRVNTLWRGIDEEGRPIAQHVIKSPEDSERAGLIYGVEALATRKARGDQVEDWEIEALIEKARRLGKLNPEKWVNDYLERWESTARFHDERMKRWEEEGW